MKRCPHCGVQDHDEAILCKSCMRSFAAAPVVATRAAGKKKASPFPFFVMVLVAGGVWLASKFPEEAAALFERIRNQVAESPAQQAADTTAPATEPPTEPAPSAPAEPPPSDPPAPAEPPAASTPPSRVADLPPAVREAAQPPVAVKPLPARPEARRPEAARPDARPAEPVRPARVAVAEPVPPPPPPSPPAEPLRVGGNIKAPTKTRDVTPSYPPVAVASRVQGIVIIEATIGADGRVRAARILRSVPLLDEAALDAVKQWQYEPTLLNGVAVPVIMTVTVQFRLQ